jgi:putative redox protein
MTRIDVSPEQGDRYRVAIRGHEIWVDQPVEDGGADSAPTPTELFVAGLASCIAFYGGRFLRRHELSAEGFAVACDFTFATDRPARVADIDIRVTPPPGLPDARRAGFLAVIEHCTVHNSLHQVPEIRIALEEPGPA